MTKSSLKNQRGFSVLYVALIIASIATTFAFVLSTTSISSIRTISLVEGRLEADNHYISCKEIALMEVRNVPEANISGSVNFGEGECEYNISGTVPTKIIDIALVMDGNERNGEVIVTQTSPRIEIE